MRSTTSAEMEKRATELARDMADAEMSVDAFESMMGKMVREYDMRREYLARRED